MSTASEARSTSKANASFPSPPVTKVSIPIDGCIQRKMPSLTKASVSPMSVSPLPFVSAYAAFIMAFSLSSVHVPAKISSYGTVIPRSAQSCLLMNHARAREMP